MMLRSFPSLSAFEQVRLVISINSLWNRRKRIIYALINNMTRILIDLMGTAIRICNKALRLTCIQYVEITKAWLLFYSLRMTTKNIYFMSDHC